MIRFTIILVMLVLALSYFGVSIRTIVESPIGQENLSYLLQLVQTGWNVFLAWITGFFEGVKNTVS